MSTVRAETGGEGGVCEPRTMATNNRGTDIERAL